MIARFTLLRGDVHHIPLNDDAVELMVSRGSIFFWENPERAFREIQPVYWRLPAGHTWAAVSAMPICGIASVKR